MSPALHSGEEMGVVFEDFFHAYEQAAARSDVSAIAASYSHSFLVAGPEGSATFENDESFLDWLTGVDAFNKAAGLTSMQVRSISGSQALSPVHTLAIVEWAARFEKTGAREITFRITYLLEDSGEGPKILAYISEEDQISAMQKLGLLSG